MVRTYMPFLFLLILFCVMLTSEGCYTVLKVRSSAFSLDDWQTDAYIDGNDYWYDPIFYQDPYYPYSYTGWYYSPWTYGCPESYPAPSFSWRNRGDGNDLDDGTPQNEYRTQRRRGVNTPDLSPKYNHQTQEIPSNGVSAEGTRQLRTLRKIDTGPSSQSQRRSGMNLPAAMVPETETHATPSFSGQTSSVPQTRKTTSDTSKSSPPEKRRGARY